MKLKRRWVWILGVFFFVCILLVILLLTLSREGHIGYKRGLVFGDKGWELQWIKATALPPDWNSTFKVICVVPAELISDIFPDFSTPDNHMREKLAAFRADIEETEAYTIEIDPDEFSTKRKRGWYPVALPGCTNIPDSCVRCTMILPSQTQIIVPALENHEVVYVSKKSLRQAIVIRLNKQ